MTIESAFSLEGLNIGITALDLEQNEHRGIAQVAKNVISGLTSEKANVFLITSYGGLTLNQNKINSRSKGAIREITLVDILNKLKGSKGTNNKYIQRILLSLKLPRIIINYYLNSGEIYGTKYLLNNYQKHIYSNSLRMSYIKELKGIISFPNLFNICKLKSWRLIFGMPKINLKKYDLDVLISTSPLSLKIEDNGINKGKLIQIIHDAIPLLYEKHPDHPFQFFHRLKDSIKADQVIFVSEETKKTINNIFNIKDIKRNKYTVINPLPSLSNILLKKAISLNSNINPKSKFILFNSSIVPRKNLDSLIYDFLSSNLPDNDYKLCVAGKIHKDDYCQYIQAISKNKNSISLLGYVNELDKAWLYLNAHAFVSPSSIEGFGIPALDASSLGLPSLLSRIPSHIEISKKIGMNKQIKLIPAKNSKEWIKNLNLLVDETNELNQNKKEHRLQSYEKNLKYLYNEFKNELKESIIQK